MGDDSALKFVEEPNNFLKCPICKTCYTEPVINVACGHTFCRRCTNNLTGCPIDSLPCDVTSLVVNRLVVGQIEELLIYCPFGLVKQNDEWVVDETGCPDKFGLGSLQEHKETCSHATTCPNSTECGQFRHMNLDDHLKHCEHTTCPNNVKGCEYRGNPSSLTSHLNTCVFNSSNAEPSSSSFSMEQSNIMLLREVSFLKEKVASLESSQSELISQLSTCIGSINTLKQNFETLHAVVDQSMMTRKRSFGSQSQVDLSSGSSIRHSNHFASPTSSPSNSSKYEYWEMPFQFKCIGTLRGHQDTVWNMTIYHSKLYSSGSDLIIKVWDLDALGKGCIQNLQGHKNNIHCSCADSGHLYTAGEDLTIKQWDLQKGLISQTVEKAHDDTICSMLILGDNLFTSSFSLIKVWNKENLVLKHSISCLKHWVRAMALSPRKDWLYSGLNNKINIWDTSTFEAVNTIEHSQGSIYSLVVTREYVMAGTEKQNILIFNARTRTVEATLGGHFGIVTSLVASPSGKFMFSGSHDHNIQMWNLETFLPIQTLSRHQGSVNTLALRGNLLLSGSEDKEIKVYRYFQSAL